MPGGAVAARSALARIGLCFLRAQTMRASAGAAYAPSPATQSSTMNPQFGDRFGPGKAQG